MAVALYPHNQTAYRNALRLMKQSGRACVVHPTGTGKSFIAFHLAEEHPDEKILWLAPSEYIFRSQKDNYLEAGGEESVLRNITFLTYSKLLYSMVRTDEQELLTVEEEKAQGKQELLITEGETQTLHPEEPPAYIILDEFHRCGAEGWGKSVEALLEQYPDSKVLGLSATHIRYLDNRRDMAEEIFGGQIASQMELSEAIAEGILPAPFYICGLYEYKDQIARLTRRINRLQNAGLQEKSAKLLDRLRHSLEQADSPADIFARYMKKDGKYIVFCSGREHMEKMITLAGEWYGALDANPTIYRAIYDSAESPEEVKRFSRDNSHHLKLLFCIDMLNEGVHVADVDGAVLLRPTASPTLYLQQVGRALSVPDKNGEHQPMIFDMVDNFDSLKCIDSFLEAYHRTTKGGAKREKPTYEFSLIDEVRESRDLFEQLGKALASSWEVCFEEAEAFYEQHGNLKVPKRYITENGIALGSWLITQRRVKAGAVPGKLTREQIEMLDSIGMEWDSRIGKAWETGYQELVKFREENGHLDVPSRYVTEGGYPLGRFVSNQRQAWKNGKAGAEASSRVLSLEREQRLNALGFIWEKSQLSWERYYAAAKAFYEQEGHLNVPAKYVTEDGLRLGAWISNKTTERESLTEEQIEALEKIGMSWGGKYDAKWDVKFKLAEQYYKEYGDLEIPRNYTVQGVRLGRWVNALRSARLKPENSHYRLDTERIKQLDSIGMRWGGESWETRYHLAELYYKEHGDLKISQAYVAEVEDGRVWLGKWVAEQRRKKRNPRGRSALTKEQEKKLEKIGMEW